MKAMLLAAGRGERMRPLTDTRPSRCCRVGGRPLIAWHLAALARAGIREVVVNLPGSGSRCARHWVMAGLRRAITYSEEGPAPLETGGGIFRALPLLGPQPFLVVNGDIWTDIDFARCSCGADALAHLVLIPNPPHHPHGDFGLDSGWVVNRDSERLTYGNVGIYRPAFFAGFAAERFPLLRRCGAQSRHAR